MQTWNINGRSYTHGELMELKRQGLDPRADNIVVKYLKNPKPLEEGDGEVSKEKPSFLDEVKEKRKRDRAKKNEGEGLENTEVEVKDDQNLPADMKSEVPENTEVEVKNEVLGDSNEPEDNI